jgi:hypothetical protein
MIISDEQIELMRERFVHRDDAFAKQKYEEGKGTSFRRVYRGSCEHEPRHRPSECPDVETIPLEPFHIMQHLRGDWTLGVYQLDKQSTVKWLCLDVDATTDYEAEKLQQTTRMLVRKIITIFGKGHALVEESGSKGYHVWLFFDGNLPAFDAYRLGHLITSELELPGGVRIEVYPKQTTLADFGNLVKLPLGIHQKTKQRCLFLNGAFKPMQDQWKVLREVAPLPIRAVQARVADIPATIVRIKDSTTSDGIPCLNRLMREGAVEGTRDAMMFSLAAMCRSRGMPPDIALVVAEAVNEKSHPPLESEVVAQKVSSAYDSVYSMYPCRSPQADSYCSSTCPFWANKVADRWNGDPVQAIGKISRD